MRTDDAETAVCHGLLASDKSNDGAAIADNKVLSASLALPRFVFMQVYKTMRFELRGNRFHGMPGAGAAINKLQQCLRLLSGFY